ncbi:MAG: DUF309 domain-containing protein [Melioribacteraceae bacterium]|nr:DUF309 domain-containing protein [Melioribacteraceae bacterium]
MIDIQKGIDLFNNSDFFAAHDYFEEIWTDTTDDSKLFYQGLIQISVGFYHFVCGNYNGAFSQLSKGSEKLAKYQPVYFNIDIEKLIDDVEIFRKLLFNSNNNSIIKTNKLYLPKIKIA